MVRVVRQLLDRPFILVHIVAETDFGIDVITEKINIGLILGSSIQGWEFEKCLFDGSVIVDVNGIFEHVVHEVWIWLDEIVQGRKNLKILPLLLMEEVKSDLVLVELHLVDSLFELISLVLNHFLSFLDFFLLLLQLFYLFVNLLLHHLEEILVLYF